MSRISPAYRRGFAAAIRMAADVALDRRKACAEAVKRYAGHPNLAAKERCAEIEANCILHIILELEPAALPEQQQV